MKKIGIFVSVGIAVLVGGLSALIVGDSMEMYQVITKPPFSPPGWVFPVVWTVLYVLMGVSSYWVFREGDKAALWVYGAQLVVNALWPVIFFKYYAFLGAFLWLVLLWALVCWMIVLFYKRNKAAACLQLPYLLWLTFAGYLNLGIYWLYP